MAWYNTVEFYVIAGAVAASVVALSALPSRRGPVRQWFAEGVLSAGEAATSPGLDVEVDERGRVVIRRRGLEGVRMDGAANLAVTVAGFDVTIEERLTAGRGDERAGEATFVLDRFGAERYHFKYNSEATGRFAAFYLTVRPGIKVSRELT